MGLFTAEEIAEAKSILSDPLTAKHGRIIDLLRPAMNRIDAQTGQANSLPYLAYLLEYQCVRESDDAKRS